MSGSERSQDIADRPLPFDGRHVRLVKLLPAVNGSDRLEIELGVFSLDAELPGYTALSYTWHGGKRRSGSRDDAWSKVWSNGVEYSITSNLWSALVHLRFSDEARYLWVDQICIRQQDKSEKSHQLPLMAEIYRQAPEGVVAWLGNGEKHIPHLMQYMSYIAGTRLWDEEKTNLSPLLNFQNGEDLRKGRQALVGFLSRRWFSRVWVIQEASAQKDRLTLIANRFSFQFSTLSAVVAETNRRMASESPSLNVSTRHPEGKSTYFAFLRACPAINSVGASGAETLQELVQTFCTWGATDPRDKIFALLGLAKDAHMYPAPDYELSCHDIYRKYTEIWLRNGLPNILTTLTFATSGHRYGLYPTWIPNWQAFIPSEPINPMRNNYKFRAGGTVDKTGPYALNGNQLALRGIRIDRIALVGESLHKFSLEDGSWLKRARSLVKAHRDKAEKNDTLETEDLALLLVLDGQSSLYELTGEERKLGEALLNGKLRKVDYAFQFIAWSTHGIDFYSGPGHEYGKLGVSQNVVRSENPSTWPKLFDNVEPAPDTEQAASKAYEDAMWAINIRSRIFCTENGSIGMANDRVKPGNSVVVLQGARMPFITEMEDDGRSQSLVSEAYIRGIMLGESIEGLTEHENIVIV